MINFEELNEKQLTYLEAIKIEPLKNFVEEALKEFGTVSKLKKANKVADIVWQKFETLGYINENVQQQFVDITIAASLLHNLFYVESDISTILKHRTKLAHIDCQQIDDRILALVYEIIESQLGEHHPIPKLKPITNSPSYTFAEAVWQVNLYNPRV